MKRLSPDVIIGGVLLIFCLVVYLIIPIQIPELRRYDASMGLSPAVFPKLAVFLITGFSIVLVVYGLRSKGDAPKDRSISKGGARARMIVTFGVLVAYVFLIDIFGWLAVTPLALAFLMWYFGERNWLLILPLAILITAGLFAFFRYIMYIILPEGIFFT
jgi:hypothetical protein